MAQIPTLPVRFYPSRTKMLGLCLLCASFVGGGVWMVRSGDRLGGYATICFFGLGLPISILNLHPKASFLLLEPDGFTFAALFRSHKVHWTDVESFAVVSVALNKMVAWNFSNDDGRHRMAKRLSRAVAGYEAALPNTYGFSAQELCDLLNQLLHQVRLANVSNERADEQDDSRV